MRRFSPKHETAAVQGAFASEPRFSRCEQNRCPSVSLNSLPQSETGVGALASRVRQRSPHLASLALFCAGTRTRRYAFWASGTKNAGAGKGSTYSAGKRDRIALGKRGRKAAKRANALFCFKACPHTYSARRRDSYLLQFDAGCGTPDGLVLAAPCGEPDRLPS